MDALGNDDNASMPEQVKRPNPWRKIMMILYTYKELTLISDVYYQNLSYVLICNPYFYNLFYTHIIHTCFISILKRIGTKLNDETHCSMRQLMDKREVQKKVQELYNIITCKSLLPQSNPWSKLAPLEQVVN